MARRTRPARRLRLWPPLYGTGIRSIPGRRVRAGPMRGARRRRR